MFITQCLASRSGLFNSESLSFERINIVEPEEHPGGRALPLIWHSLLADLSGNELNSNHELWQDFYLQLHLSACGQQYVLTRNGNDRVRLCHKDRNTEHELFQIPSSEPFSGQNTAGFPLSLFRLPVGIIDYICLPDSSQPSPAE